MELLFQVLVSGLLLGGLYALIALGLALVWGVLNIVNLSHGALIMLGAYVTYFLVTGAYIDPFAALPIAAAVLFAIGYLIQRGVLNLVIRGPMFNTLLITFGIEVVLTYLTQLWFSADFRTTTPDEECGVSASLEGPGGDSRSLALTGQFIAENSRPLKQTAVETPPIAPQQPLD